MTYQTSNPDFDLNLSMYFVEKNMLWDHRLDKP